MDGGNVFAWLPDMAAATQAGDADGFVRALHRAANAPIYDSRMGMVVLRLRPVLASLPLPSSCIAAPGFQELAKQAARPADASLSADIEVSAIEMAFAMPGLQGLGLCRRQAHALAAAALDDCRRLLSRFADGDTLLEQGIALPTLIELSPDDATRAQWRERYRRQRWLQTFLGEAQHIDGFAWRMWAEGEVNVLRDHARKTGRWPPPDGWLPDDERGRTLITGEPGSHG